LNVTNDVSFNGNLIVGQTVYANKNMGIGRVPQYPLDVSGTTNIIGNLIVYNDVSFNGNLVIRNNLICGNITTNNNTINAGTGTISCGVLTASTTTAQPVSQLFTSSATSNNPTPTYILKVGSSTPHSTLNYPTNNFIWNYNSGGNWGAIGLDSASSTQITYDNNGVNIGSYAKPSNTSSNKLYVDGSANFNGSLTLSSGLKIQTPIAVSSVSNSLTINCNNYSFASYTLTMTESITGITFSNSVTGGQYIIYITNSSATSQPIYKSLGGSTIRTSYSSNLQVPPVNGSAIIKVYNQGTYFLLDGIVYTA
jgi:hypothetical protein